MGGQGATLPMIGQTLDRYRVESKLGEGGMGVVYKARDTHLDRTVAIKVLPRDKVCDPVRKQRFVQEAKAASALNHPGIITVHDIRSDAGIDFIVMEFVEGETLDQMIPPKGLRPAQALRYSVGIADALAKAHEAGIIHRDLKPSNVMVTKDGRTKILDFGLAKLIEPSSSPSEATTLTSPLTEDGMVLGTTAYMSPEQAEGRELSPRSDIFSFGSVLYEMLTGRKAFPGGSTLSILSRILNEDPTPPAQLAPSMPLELEKIVLRCLRKDPARRYQSMADLKVALEDIEEESRTGKPVSGAAWSLRWVWAVVLPVLLIAGYFAWRAWRVPEAVAPLRAVPLTSLPGVQRYPSFSPEGDRVAFTWDGPKQDNPDIYVQQIGVGTPLRLTSDANNDFNPVWSPDGRWIAFLRSQSEAGKSELRLIPPLGGPERKLTEVGTRSGVNLAPPFMSWCPNSRCLVVTNSPDDGAPDALFVISLDTSEKRQLTFPKPPAGGDTNPAISPDSKWLVFRRMSGLFVGELLRVRLNEGIMPAGEERRLTPPELDASYPTWIPGSQAILFSTLGAGLWRLDISGEKPEEHQPARLPFVGEAALMSAISQPQPGRPARLVYVRSLDDFNIWRIETSGRGLTASSPPHVSISSTRYEGFPQFSPDGRRLAFASDRSGGGEIWIADHDGSNPAQLVSMGPAMTGGPRWSPDGEKIVFHSMREGQWEVYVVPAAGGQPRNLTSHPAAEGFPSFSRDGNWVYFSSSRETRTSEQQVWKMPVSGGEAARVTSTPGYVPTESPDGAYVYYVEAMDKPSALWRVPTTGGPPVRVLEGVVLGNYVVTESGIYFIDKPSGQKGVYYLDKPSGETRLQYFDFATHKIWTVARNLGTVELWLSVSPDGRTILYPRMDSSIDDLMLVENFR